MTSPLAESALSRRFFIGPLIALALVGPTRTGAPTVGPNPTASPTSSASPSPGANVAATALAITKAHDAEGVYYVDNLVYAAAQGDELKALQKIEPAVHWGVQVIVELPVLQGAQSQVVILRAPIPGGGSLCMSEVSEVQDANTWYARVAGKARCPGRKLHMPGWSKDRQRGWGI